jgi:hypothetical protein
MSFLEPIDATGYHFNAWITFAFDRPVSETPWYYAEEMYFECDPATVIGYYTILFRDPRRCLAPYDEAQLEQGLWFVVNAQLSDWVWSNDWPLQLRVDCIAAMPTMFREFLSEHPLDTACFMWWDMLRYFGDDPDDRIVDAMVVALEEVLRSPVRHCQMSALHGLGHLRHDSKETIIRSFVAANHDLDSEVLQYANQAIAGTVL